MANLEDKEQHSPQSVSPRAQAKWLPSKLLKYLASIVAFGVAVYVFLIVSSPSPLKEHSRSRNVSYEQLTIVLNTFERHDLMQCELLPHFCLLRYRFCSASIEYYSKCELVKYIYVVWSEKQPPSERMVAKYSNGVHPKV